VPRRPSHAPKHRALLPAIPNSSPRKPLRSVLTRFGAAAAVTGLAVSSGLVLTAESSSEPASAALAQAPVADTGFEAARAELLNRTPAVSRSVRRAPVDATKARVLNQESGGQVTKVQDLTTGDPRTVARAMLAKYGFGQDQFSCLDSLYVSESGWKVHADNPTSSAYGIPQALPGSKMSTAGADWEDNAATQIKWGLGYIKARYGTPCEAWSFKQGNNWY
jgi:hypothetical protein